MSSGLYGLEHTNRTDDQHYSKNRFNSSFPTALACYMMENNIPAIYARLVEDNGELKVKCDKIPIRKLFNCGKLHANELEFDFESKYEPFQAYAFDSIDGIDLVVKDLNGKYLAPVEIKLSVLPDDVTATHKEEDWGCEIVIRPATTSYCAFSLWNSVKKHKSRVRDIFEDACGNVGEWTNESETLQAMPSIIKALNLFESEFIKYQKPLVMQTIWRTEGKRPILSNEAFDIVVWSDMAFSRLFIDNAEGEKMSRLMRATAKMAHCLLDLSRMDKVNVENIYRKMAYGKQTDKEVAVSGTRWRKYITSDRAAHPIVPYDALPEILSQECMGKLSPERRLDQTLVMMYLMSK